MPATAVFAAATSSLSSLHLPPSLLHQHHQSALPFPSSRLLLHRRSGLISKPSRSLAASDAASPTPEENLPPAETEPSSAAPPSPPVFDFDFTQSEETEEEIVAAYERRYGPAYSGVSVLGNDIYVEDAKFKKVGGKIDWNWRERPDDEFREQVVQVSRVAKVVKGGKNFNFRAVVVVGDKRGHVGVGVGKAREVVEAIAKACANGRRNVFTVPITKNSTFPHRAEGDYGAARVMLKPAPPGTGLLAGGAARIVLQMAGYRNATAKQLRSKNALNNARATVAAMQKMRLLSDVARERGIPIEELLK